MAEGVYRRSRHVCFKESPSTAIAVWQLAVLKCEFFQALCYFKALQAVMAQIVALIYTITIGLRAI